MAEQKILKKPNLFESIALGGASCVFTVNFVHPIETIKTRMQITGNGVFATITSLVKTEGIPAFWKGIVSEEGWWFCCICLHLFAFVWFWFG